MLVRDPKLAWKGEINQWTYLCLPHATGRHVVLASVGAECTFLNYYKKNYLSDSPHILHTTPPGGLDVPVGGNCIFAYFCFIPFLAYNT